MNIRGVKTIQEAKTAERFVFEALKPGGFGRCKIPIPNLKDHLAWLSWANLRRQEQPTFIAIENNKVVAGIFGEPVETWFDKGESEIQELIIAPGYESKEMAYILVSKIVEFYKKNKARQIHFWVLEKDFNAGRFEDWQNIAMDSFGFAFKGFRRISKWRGKPICKIEKYI